MDASGAAVAPQAAAASAGGGAPAVAPTAAPAKKGGAPKTPKAPTKKKAAQPRAKKAPAATDQPKKVAAKKRTTTPRVRKGKQAAAAAAAAPTAVVPNGNDAGSPAIGPEMELRRQYLQQLYNVLHQAHPEQDPNAVGQYASTIEMEHFHKFTTRNEYANALNGELAKLSEIARSRVSKTPGTANPGNQSTGEPARPSGFANDQSVPTSSAFDASRGQPRSAGPAGDGYQQRGAESTQDPQAQYRVYAGAQGGPSRQPNGLGQDGAGSSMNGQAFVQAQRLNARSTTSQDFEQQTYQAAQYYAASQPPQQSQPQQQQPQQMQRQHAMQTAQQLSRQEFANQLQQYDRNVLIDFLWNQKSALEHWQSRSAQLEMQVASLQNALNLSYQQRAPYDPLAQRRSFEYPQGPSTEAKDQRVNDGYVRGYPQRVQEQTPASAPVRQTLNEETLRAHNASMEALSRSPEQYWGRVGVMKSMYMRDLMVAYQALENHHAPPNSAQSAKADNLKHNVGLALTVLNETPQASEPRSFDVLDSIERFMQNTVKPIVDRIQSRTAGLVSPAANSDNQGTAPSATHQGGYSARGESGGAEGAFPSNTQQQQQQQHHHHQQQQQHQQHQQHQQQLQPRLPSPSLRHFPRAQSLQPQSAEGRNHPAPMMRTVPPPRDAPRDVAQAGQSEAVLNDPGRLLNGQESPFGDLGAAKMSVPTFSPSERRTASAAQVTKDANVKNASSYAGTEDDMNAFDALEGMQFEDDGRKVADSSSSGPEKVSPKGM